MVSTRDTKSMPIGNSQLSNTGYESCLLYYMVTRVEQKVFIIKGEVYTGTSPSTMNKRKSVLQALLTHIRLAKIIMCDL